MRREIEGIIKQMTLEEKAGLCSGADAWRTKAVERLNIPRIAVSDGPHGLRREPEIGEFIGFNESEPATCFPAESAIACSWDKELIKRVGQAIGEECLVENVAVLLGPGVNIKRDPLCGRNFEYYSEDPYLTGELAAAFINGVQSKGIGTSLKHFAVNNQESSRMTIDAVVDERALREIYLAGFEAAVKKAKPATLMCSYNKVCGTYASENKYLLSDILRDEWKFEGLVMSDWGAVNERVEALKAGLALEMPGGSRDNDARIVEAVKTGKLDEGILDRTVADLLELILAESENPDGKYTYDKKAHHSLAREAAENSAVLLKNEDNILPLDKGKRITIIGEFAKNPRYQGSGSSLINPLKLDNPYDTLKEYGIEFTYAAGYNRRRDSVDQKLIDEAVEAAKASDAVIIFAGLPSLYESEGYDRAHMKLPENQNELIRQVAGVTTDIVVVLMGGSPMEMPWINDVKGLINMYLPGQAGGSAAVNLLFGKSNPCGKLAETYPIKYEDCSSGRFFPGGPKTVEYRESIYVGYRYFDTAKADVLFPFGFGLSYTTFEYSNLKISKKSVSDNESVVVTADIHNTGSREGAEVVELYIHEIDSRVFKADKELKGFAKVFLRPGEKRTVTFELSKQDFSYYNVKARDWCVESGEYEILIGASSRDIKLKEVINIKSQKETECPYDRSLLKSYYELDGSFEPGENEFELLYGKPLPSNVVDIKEKFTYNSTLKDIMRKLTGRIISKIVVNIASKNGVHDEERAEVTVNMMKRMMPENPLRSIAISSGGMLNFAMLDGLLLMLNGKRTRGIIKIIKSMMRKQHHPKHHKSMEHQV